MNPSEIFPVYLDLTPENASKYGLNYISDCILDLEAPQIIAKTHWDDLAKGYIFGQAAARMGAHNNVGMYLPISDTSIANSTEKLEELHPINWLVNN